VIVPAVSSDHTCVDNTIRFPLDCKLLAIITVRALKQWSAASYERLYITEQANTYKTYALKINLKKNKRSPVITDAKPYHDE